jgi:NYN domain
VRVGTYVYVDGFNLYYGVFGKERGWRSAAYKWLDLSALAANVWPALTPIAAVRYFTALVKPTPADPQVGVRQQAYIRGLRAVGATVHFGTFKVRRKNVRLIGAAPQVPPSTTNVVLSAEAQIGKYDEKGSDVNLATYLVRDAAKGDCTTAIVVSNDSDLVEPIRLVRAEFGVDVYLINPQQRAVTELVRSARSCRDLKLATLAACQLPRQLTDAFGTVSRPAAW